GWPTRRRGSCWSFRKRTCASCCGSSGTSFACGTGSSPLRPEGLRARAEPRRAPPAVVSFSIERVTNDTARRLRLARLSLATGSLLVLLEVQHFLVGLVPDRFEGPASVGVVIVAAVLGMVAIREVVGLVARRFHGPQAVIWR